MHLQIADKQFPSSLGLVHNNCVQNNILSFLFIDHIDPSARFLFCSGSPIDRPLCDQICLHNQAIRRIELAKNIILDAISQKTKDYVGPEWIRE
jgi:hypothetical protein